MKLFGITQRELVGDLIGRLFPEPLCNYAQVGYHKPCTVCVLGWGFRGSSSQ
jgi:hypothetical protein